MSNLLPLAYLLVLWADPPAAPAAPSSPLDVVSALETVLSDAIAKAEPSVVAIARERSEGDVTTAIKGRNPAPPFEPFGPDTLTFDYGSGVVVGDKGEILTAFHMVKGASRIHVRSLGNPEFEAEIIAADPRSDLAVIVPREFKGLPSPKLPPLPLGDATKLRKGAFLVALGNPFNAAQRDGRPSASWGILSNVARRIEQLDENQPLSLKNYPTLLQLDSKLNLGMSGGAVINLKGELVGLTSSSANAAGFDAMAGYAIPLDAMGRRAVEALRQGKEVEYGFLGIGLDRPTRSTRVTQAQPGTPAAIGNVLVDDIILAVGDTPLHDVDDLVLAINAVPVGNQVRLKIRRRNEIIERTVELAKFRVDGEVIATNRPPAWRGLRVDFTSTLPHRMFGADLLGAMAAGGVAIAEVEEGSAAEKAGLKAGQVIKSVDGHNVRSPSEFAKAIAGRDGPVVLGTDSGPVTLK